MSSTNVMKMKTSAAGRAFVGASPFTAAQPRTIQVSSRTRPVTLFGRNGLEIRIETSDWA
jgi:hypothetical protein